MAARRLIGPLTLPRIKFSWTRRPWLHLAVPIVAVAAAVWLYFRNSYVNYDAGWSLVWADQLVHGSVPDFAGGPTPHPLVNAVSVPLTALGADAGVAIGIMSCLSIAALVVFGVALGRESIGRLAAVIVLVLLATRTTVFGLGILQYADTLFVVLCLGATLWLTRKPDASWGPLALLAVAGLVRPEAWLFGAVLAGVRLRQGVRPATGLIAVAVSAPVLWVLTDLAITGDPFYSFISTRADTIRVEHKTGLAAIPTTLPTRITDVIGKPAGLAGAIGLILALVFLRKRTRLLLIALGMSLVAAIGEAIVGMPILGRYATLPGVFLLVFATVALLGWRVADVSGRVRAAWIAGSVITALVLLAYLPIRVDELRTVRAYAVEGQRGHDDALALIRGHAPALSCGPIAVSSRRLQPLISYWLHRPNGTVVTSQVDRPRYGTYLVPANDVIRATFKFDRNDVPPDDPRQALVYPPSGDFKRVGANSSWELYQRCAR